MPATAPLSLKSFGAFPEGLTCGHRLCAGCPESIIVRQVLFASQPAPCVVANATGCLEVASSIYPYTAWKVPWIHCAFENVAATLSGVESAYKAFQRQGFYKDTKFNFIAFAGDGGTYDIGLQSLSGAWERGHSFLFVCLNNEAYMNTGIQRSSATPLGASTTTSPAGAMIPGKIQWKKNMSLIAAAHKVPYIAQTAPWNLKMMDLAGKVKKALQYDGPSFINTLSPCSRGWRFEPKDLLKIVESAIETCYWPLFEVIEGKWILNYRPKEKKPVVEFLRLQGRFKHLLGKEESPVVAQIQKKLDEDWDSLLKLCEDNH